MEWLAPMSAKSGHQTSLINDLFYMKMMPGGLEND